MKKIGVIGCGFVGSAVVEAFKVDHRVMVVDPAKFPKVQIGTLNEWEPDVVFICVPTPEGLDGAVDGSIVRQVLRDLEPGPLVVVKSTITPEYLIAQNMHKRIVFNPEFLTQRKASDDFLNPPFMIYGGDYENSIEVHDIFMESRVNMPEMEHVAFCDIASACFVKYTLNCYLAMKVTFMNEIYQLHKMHCSTSWDEFRSMLTLDPRMGKSHLQVPGPDGEFGFGGACFPKDTQAFAAFARQNGKYLCLIESAIRLNHITRGEEVTLPSLENQENTFE